jgi:hypothetical protein
LFFFLRGIEKIQSNRLCCLPGKPVTALSTKTSPLLARTPMGAHDFLSPIVSPLLPVYSLFFLCILRLIFQTDGQYGAKAGYTAPRELFETTEKYSKKIKN